MLIDPSNEEQFAGPMDPDSVITGCADASCPVYEEIEAVRAMTSCTAAGSIGALPLIVIGHDPGRPGGRRL